jgi:hypothetical protein
MKPETVGLAIQAFAALGALGWFTQYLNGRREQKRKDTVEPTEAVVRSAVALVEPLEQRVHALTERVTTLEAQERLHREVLHTHAEWDRLAYAIAIEFGASLPKPPPLFPH